MSAHGQGMCLDRVTTLANHAIIYEVWNAKSVKLCALGRVTKQWTESPSWLIMRRYPRSGMQHQSEYVRQAQALCFVHNAAARGVAPVAPVRGHLGCCGGLVSSESWAFYDFFFRRNIG